MEVKDLLINTLTEAFNYPVIQQGSLSDNDAYYDNFFTFFNNNSSDSNFYNNQETITIWDFDLNFYSNNPQLVNSVLLEAKTLLKENGFIVDGAGYDVISDETTHTGRGMNLIYIQKVR